VQLATNGRIEAATDSVTALDAQPPPEWRNFLGLGGNKRRCDALFTAPDIAQASLEIVGKPPF